MPRVLPLTHCNRCRTELPEPTPRVCPSCGASLQKRFLTAGCLSSAPPLLFLAAGLFWLVS